MDKDKKGAVLILTLLVMFVGAIILGGLFMYLDTSLLLTARGEENAVNYYAADSGIEDAILWLQHEPWLPHEEPLAGWNVSCDPRNPPDQPCLNSYTIGNRAVYVSVVNPQSEGFGNNTFQINSTATVDSGARTEITSYIQMAQLDFYRFGDDVITSNTSVDIKQGDPIQGNISYVDYTYCNEDPKETEYCPDIDPDDGLDCCEKTVNGSMNYAPDGIEWWPETWAITEYFKDQVDIFNPLFIDENDDGEDDVTGTIDAEDYPTLGPVYRDGNLDIQDSGCKEPEECPRRITLNGTVFVTGHLTMGGAKDFILDLNGQVIFVEYDGEQPDEAIIITQECIIEGSGAIFAIGSILFQPSINTGEDDFLFIMSIEGGTHLQPNGDFYGSVAGHDYVEVWPGNNIIHNDSDILWNQFPDDDVVVTKVLTYDIIDR